MEVYEQQTRLNGDHQEVLAAYDAHDVEGMLALCADGAQGRYLPYGKNSAMPIRGGLEQIWRGFPQARAGFRGRDRRDDRRAKTNTVAVQALLGGTMPADVPGARKERRGRTASPMLTSSATTRTVKSSRLDCYWDNTAINAHQGERLVSLISGETLQ